MDSKPACPEEGETFDEVSPKQEIYRHLLLWNLPHLRNAAARPWWRRIRHRTAYFEAELIHNLHASLFEREFVAHDLHFLNVQAKAYYEECGSRSFHPCSINIGLIRELFALVPQEMRGGLQWSGPA